MDLTFDDSSAAAAPATTTTAAPAVTGSTASGRRASSASSSGGSGGGGGGDRDGDRSSPPQIFVNPMTLRKRERLQILRSAPSLERRATRLLAELESTVGLDKKLIVALQILSLLNIELIQPHIRVISMMKKNPRFERLSTFKLIFWVLQKALERYDPTMVQPTRAADRRYVLHQALSRLQPTEDWFEFQDIIPCLSGDSKPLIQQHRQLALRLVRRGIIPFLRDLIAPEPCEVYVELSEFISNMENRLPDHI